MLFVPWIYLVLERKKTPSETIKEKALKQELHLIFALLEGKQTEGVIGSDAKKNLKRLPSKVYWTGLGSWNMRLFERSQEQHHRFLKGSSYTPINLHFRLTDICLLSQVLGGCPGKTKNEKKQAECIF
jgi:hypothetical protein